MEKFQIDNENIAVTSCISSPPSPSLPGVISKCKAKSTAGCGSKPLKNICAPKM